MHGAQKGLNRFMVDEAMGMIPDIDAALLVIDVDVAMQGGGGKGGLGEPSAILRELRRGAAARSCWRSTRSTR